MPALGSRSLSRITGSDRISAKISVTVMVVVNGSPMPSVTGLSPVGGAESSVTSRCKLRRTRAIAAVTAGW